MIRTDIEGEARAVGVPSEGIVLEGELVVPADAPGVVLFAHGSGSSRHSVRNRYVASVLRQAGLGTLLFDLLTPAEEAVDEVTAEYRFDIDRLTRRLADAARWILAEPSTADRAVGFFGAGTGAAAALRAAAELGDRIGAVVSRGGRPDLAGEALPLVTAPTLLIVGGADDVVITLNEQARARLRCGNRLHVVPGAGHLFAEPGTLEEVARAAAEWFDRHLRRERRGV